MVLGIESRASGKLSKHSTNRANTLTPQICLSDEIEFHWVQLNLYVPKLCSSLPSCFPSFVAKNKPLHKSLISVSLCALWLEESPVLCTVLCGDTVSQSACLEIKVEHPGLAESLWRPLRCSIQPASSVCSISKALGWYRMHSNFETVCEIRSHRPFNR